MTDRTVLTRIAKAVEADSSRANAYFWRDRLASFGHLPD